MHGIKLTLPILLALTAGRALADRTDYDHQNSRLLLEDHFTETYQQRRSIYQSAPVAFVIPTYKTVSFAIAADRYEYKLKSDTFGRGYLGGQRAVQRLELTGQRFALYVAISLRRIGLGFSAETGAKNTLFTIDSKDLPAGTADFSKAQYSEMEYRAVGLYFYTMPYSSGGERPLIASVFAGAKDYNVNHKVSSLEATGDVDRYVEKFRYNLTEFELGMLVEYRILKRFSLMPWLDYTYMDVHDPVNQADEILKDDSNASQQKVRIARSLKGDTRMYWLARPRVDIGLDLIFKWAGLAIHIGEAFGYLLEEEGTDIITDNSYYISFSWDTQGE